jgi:tetratricopeptide (TPR) repeat protein
MVLLAERASAIAADLDPLSYGPELTADLRARCFAELGNAYRVADDLEAAERALRRAGEESAQGTQDPLLLARIMDLTASLRGAQRRFGEALELLDAVYQLYERHGDRHNAGRALISKGLYTGYDNDPEEAVRLLSTGLTLIHPASDPKLVISAIHNLMMFLADSGRFHQAQRLLRRARPAYDAEGDRLNLVKLRWLEGKIAAGLGRLRRAEQLFGQARQELEASGLHYHAALVSLDLAAVWLSQGKSAETRSLVENLVATFRARRIARESLAALVLLKESFDLDRVEPIELLRAVSRYLKGSRQALTN